MIKTGNKNSFIASGLGAWALGLAGCALCIGLPAHADDDPFQLDNGHWMSSAHYQDAATRGILDKPAPPPEQPAVQPTPAPEATTALAAPVVASPARPIDLPVMPGMNKGFDVKVNSTEDDSETPAPVLTPEAAADASPDIRLSDKNWSLPSAAPRAAQDAKNDDSDAPPPPINVRMSFLPNQAIAPVPSPEHPSATKMAHIALEKSIENKAAAATAAAAAANKPADAACAAIDAYKKQQLTAIQSDRQTLKALEDAISSLGLQKQLGFITGSNSSLGVTNASGGMDTPTTAVR